jgi:hypothetical protein
MIDNAMPARRNGRSGARKYIGSRSSVNENLATSASVAIVVIA